ncbi:hypothetical protein HPP92_012272 [Vanilla planifolia]|uniref:E3 ubiquitin-protein ligase PRT1 n=1 Tax=Vanilla planifolia TaxID=51239 RepID=A0A835QTF9_VANPL|nr:hypothetical protein HPP92_012272 [Vanilla planifolia]
MMTSDEGAARIPSAIFPSEISLEESYNSSFECCVCLDLLYKPVVLACGHVSCFWCVHKAMHGLRASHCAICRRPYIHFPSICELLHLLILKMEPTAYKRREIDVLEEERRLDIFSPHFDSLVSENASSGILRDVGGCSENLKDRGNIPSKRVGQEDVSRSYDRKHISTDDVLCAMCKQLLFQPAVLNCGHVFCASCLASVAGEIPKCLVCKSLHPGPFPNVCLDLDHLVEEQFPTEYAMRRVKLQQLYKENLQCGVDDPSVSENQNVGIVSKKLASSEYLKESHLLMDEDLFNAHVGVGCDSCGVYPIIGKRYKCKDCKEAIGFDLCEPCYNTSSKRPGRFNQQHRPDHQFELDDSHMLSRIFMQRSTSMEDSVQDLSDYDSLNDPADQNGAIIINSDGNINSFVDNNDGDIGGSN